MNRLKKIIATITTTLLIMTGVVVPAHAAAPWNVTGVYQATFLLNGDASNTPYTHDMILTQTGSSVSGNGGYPAGGPYTYSWHTTSGNLSGSTLNLDVLYDTGATGTVMHMTGNIASDGSVTGTWDDNFGGSRTGTWSITKGVSIPRILTPANNSTVSQANMVKVDWTDAVGVPPFTYQYEAYSDPNYANLVYQSGWLGASEIPTPGTPPGDYYIRVRAGNGVDTSDWSNGPSNPYHFKVVLNDFPVPAQCDQNIVYNKIVGTNGVDNITGTSGNDLILAKDGADKVDGKGGNDCIVGDGGADTLTGGTGNDVILGGDGADVLNGNEGMDKLYGEAGADTMYGGDDNDYLDGGLNADSANGQGQTDTCIAEIKTSCEL